MMDAYSLPFYDIPAYRGVCIAGVHIATNTVCLNMMEFHTRDMMQKIEWRIEGTMTHETIHAVLNETIELGRSPGLDYFDEFDKNYPISNNLRGLS